MSDFQGQNVEDARYTIYRSAVSCEVLTHLYHKIYNGIAALCMTSRADDLADTATEQSWRAAAEWNVKTRTVANRARRFFHLYNYDTLYYIHRYDLYNIIQK